MKFTKELEENNMNSFLDVLVKRTSTAFETSVYRKKTFTGLGTSFFSFIPNPYGYERASAASGASSFVLKGKI